MKRAVAAILLTLLVALTWGIRSGHVRIPPDWNPWSPLDIRATPNLLTRYKLAQLSNDPLACQSVLTSTRWRYETIPDETTGDACGYFNAVRIVGTSTQIDAPFALTCRTAVSLALWEHHVLQPTAHARYGSAVAKIEHFGSYSCRNVYGRPNATRSRHATAEAFDIAGFVLQNGERIRVVNDWAGEHASFLRTVRDGACRFFDAVLSPDYNTAHRDHFHFDRGGFRTCR